MTTTELVPVGLSTRTIARRLELSRLALFEGTVDIAWLAGFRALFGLTMCVSMLRFIAYGWIDDFFALPKFHFKYWGFAWVPVLSPGSVHALFWALAAIALSIALGFCFRASAVLLFAGLCYLQLIDVTTYLNHYYLASLLALLLAISPAERAYSVDALLWKNSTTRIASVWIYLFRFQVGLVYGFAGLAKANSDWLIHSEPLRIWLGSRTGLPILGVLLSQSWAAPVMSWAGFLFDSTIVGWLLYRRTRLFAFAAVIAFHLLTRVLFPIGMFSVIMILSALVFFPPSWPRTVAAKLERVVHRRSPSLVAPTPPSASAERAPNSLRGLALMALGVYCTVQVLLPLRFLAYGGNVLWHEQGMRFSWRVMVREKNGSVTFLVRSKKTGLSWQVSPSKYLNRLQEREMSGQPDLILQLAHRIHDDYAREGRGPVEVRADVLVSLNGRRMVRMIDPEVDLAEVHDGIGRAAWIEPAPEEAPPHILPARS